MAARATMAGLITLVRGFINDPSGAEQTFTDEEIQQQLDSTRDRIIGLDLIAYGTLPSTEFFTHLKNFENGAVLTENDATLTPVTSDPINGYWTFSEPHYSIQLSGWSYDVYAASAELLTIWSARLGQSISQFSADGSSYTFENRTASLLKMAAEYRAKSPLYGAVKSVRMVRDDYAA